MKTIEIFACLFLALGIFRTVSYSQSGFMPWNPDVAVADENINMVSKPGDKTVSVFSGPQGGAYFMIRAFQIFISPQNGPSCIYRPTCSQYGRIAVLKYGALVGSFLAGDRLIRCNPFNEPGEDPVPDSIFK